MNKECLFCGYKNLEVVEENSLSYAIRDKPPVTELHTLVVSKKHYETVFDLPSKELSSILELAKNYRKQIMVQDDSVKGFNFGSNSGEVAGQKIQHVHFHLIPRRIGDIKPSPAIE
jgi:diadenosine tetraphosphate (Ap4A) HIT family hydrolase